MTRLLLASEELSTGGAIFLALWLATTFGFVVFVAIRASRKRRRFPMTDEASVEIFGRSSDVMPTAEKCKEYVAAVSDALYAEMNTASSSLKHGRLVFPDGAILSLTKTDGTPTTIRSFRQYVNTADVLIDMVEDSEPEQVNQLPPDDLPDAFRVPTESESGEDELRSVTKPTRRTQREGEAV